MFKHRIKFLLTSAFLTLSLIGCTSIPQSNTTDAGIKQAVGTKETKQDNTLTEETTHLIKTENGYTCNVNLGSNDDKLILKTDFPDINYNDIDILSIIPSTVEFDRQSIIKHFFAGDEQLQEVNDIEPYNKENSYDGNNEEGMLKKTSINHAFHVTNADNTVTFSRFSDSSFFFRNETLDDKYMAISRNNYEFSSEENISEKYTFNMAWKELEDKFAVLGIDNLKPEYYQGFSNDGNIFYSIYFMIQIGNLPLANGLAHGDINEINAYGYAEVGNSGVGMIQVDNMLWDIAESKKTKVITPEQLIHVLEQHVNNGDIICSSSMTFNRAELMYMLTTDNWDTYTLKPVWRIYVPTQQYLLNSDIIGNVTTDIIIDGESGDLISVN